MREGSLIAGKYRLRRLIGDGAAGEVWAALNERTDREVALKLIVGADQELRERALREARALGRVSHRGIVDVLDAGETDRGEPFLVMPLLCGETLGERLRREGRIVAPKAAAIALEVARGLAAAHAAGVIHRDLKPSNIFLHRDMETGLDQVKVLDFGVSKMIRSEGPPTTRTGDLVGSPAYMSPEQARADWALDQRTDLWSLGVVLFEMLAGRRPFTSRTIAVISDIVSAPIPALAPLVPGLDPRLALVVSRCLERDVALRVQSAQELAALLRPCAGVEDVWGSADGNRQSPAPQQSAPAASKEEEDQIATVHSARPPLPLGGRPPPSSSRFRPVPTTLLDSSHPSEVWRQQAAAARMQALQNSPALPPGGDSSGSGSGGGDVDKEMSTAEMDRSPVRGFSPSQASVPPPYAPQPPAGSAFPQPPSPPRELQPAPRGRRVGLLLIVGATSVLTLVVLVLLVIGLAQRLGGARNRGPAAQPPAGAEPEKSR